MSNIVRNFTPLERRDMTRVLSKLIFEAGYDEALTAPLLVNMLDAGATSTSAPASPGNSALLPLLSRNTQLLNLYVSPSGNDATGDGLTPATAFREVQRALDEIPSGGPTGYPTGIVQIQCAAGNYKPFKLKSIITKDKLSVIVNGDTTVADAVLLFPTGVHPPLINAPSKVNAGEIEYTFGAPHGVTFSEGSHWIDSQFPAETDGPLQSFATTVDGLRSAANPNKIRIADNYDSLAGVTANVRPIVCTVDTTQATTGVFFWNCAITNQNRNNEDFFSSGVRLLVQGFKFVADYNLVFTGVSLYGCDIIGTPGQTNAYIRENDHQIYSVYAKPDALTFEGGLNVFITGIYACNTTIEGPTSEFFVGGVFRGLDGNDVSLYIGGPTGGRIGSATDVEIEATHFEAGIVDLQAAAARWGNHAPVSFDGAVGIVARYGARQRFQTVVGAVTGDCITLEPGCHIFDGLLTLNTNLVTTGVGTHELVLRHNLTDSSPTTRNFSQGQFTDTARIIYLGG